MTVQAIAQMAFTYLPAMNTLFGSAPISGSAWLRIVAIAAAISMVVGLEKWLRAARSGAHRTAASEWKT